MIIATKLEEQNTSGDGIQAGLCVLLSVTLDKSLPWTKLEFPHRKNEGGLYLSGFSNSL